MSKRIFIFGIFKMLALACSLFFLNWFSNDNQDEIKKKDDAKYYSVKKRTKANMDEALDIMLKNGFTPQIPAIRLPIHILKVSQKKDLPYEKVNILASKKPSVIHFWATWCGPCKRELPNFDIFANKVASQIEIYTITSELMDGTREAALGVWSFYKNKNIMNLNVVCDENNSLAINLGVTGIPCTFLVSSNGMVLGQFLGAVNWRDEELQEAILAFLV